MTTRFDRINGTEASDRTRTQKPAKKKAAPAPPSPPDDRNVYQKIADDVYRNQLPYPSFRDKTPEAEEGRKAYYAETRRLEELFKQDLFAEHGVQNNPRREEAYRIAWDHGHSSGYSDVATYFAEIVDLIFPTAEERDRLDLTEDEEYGAFAALCTMIEDVHAPQDQMTEAQWAAAEALYRRLEERINLREAGKPRRRTRKAAKA